MLDNQNGNYWPTGEINFIGENSDNNEGHGGFQFKVNNNTVEVEEIMKVQLHPIQQLW